MAGFLGLLDRVADSDAVVRITGESGVGKGFLARLLHRKSARAAAPCVEVACANLPEELFESELFGREKGAHTDATERREGRLEIAGGGTLILDGIEELSLAAQAKLLRVLQERAFERLGGTETLALRARIVATSATDLEEAVRNGTFRRDLFYRLDVVCLEVPPLRERAADIEPLARMFLRHYRRAHRRRMRFLGAEALRRLQRYPWPGNVRELRNAMEHAVLTAAGREVVPSDLRLGSPGDRGLLEEAGACRMSLAQMEAAYIGRVLAATGGNRTRAAAILGISRKTLLAKRKKYGLS
jgi:DNA-binding NtrC family response regulator